jgi:hypothetical protein
MAAPLSGTISLIGAAFTVNAVTGRIADMFEQESGF